MNRFFVLVSFFAVVLTACSNEESVSNEGGAVVEQTIPLSEEEKKVLAKEKELEEIKEQIFTQQGNYLFHLKASDLYLELDKPHSALEEAKNAIFLDTLDARVFLAYGKANFALDQFHQSKIGFEKCLKLDPENTDCITELAQFYMFKGDKEKAMDYVNKALKIDETLFKPYYIKGWVYLLGRDTATAASSFKTAIELNPNFYDGFIMLGDLYYKANHPLAEEYLKSALDVNPNSAEAQYFLATFYQRNQRFDEAFEMYNKMLEVDSTQTNVLYNKGYIYLTDLQKTDSAIYFFNKAISYDTNFVNAWYNQGLAYHVKKDFSKRDSCLNKVLELQPDYNIPAELKRKN